LEAGVRAVVEYGERFDLPAPAIFRDLVLSKVSKKGLLVGEPSLSNQRGANRLSVQMRRGPAAKATHRIRQRIVLSVQHSAAELAVLDVCAS